MRIVVAFCVAVIFVLTGDLAVSAKPKDRKICQGGNLSLVISACTRVLNDRNEPIENRVRAYQLRGQGYANLGVLDRALVDYNEAIKLNPKSATSYQLRGEAYIDKKEFKRALADLSEALNLEPNLFAARRDRADTYLQMKNYDLAIADYNEAIKLNSRSGETYFGRGSAYYEADNYNAAIEDFSAIAKADPKFYADEQDLVTDALAKARTLKLRSEFGKNYNIGTWASVQELKINPFRFKGQVVGVRANFKQMISEREALFDGLLVTVDRNVDFKRADQQFLIAVKDMEFTKDKSISADKTPIPSGTCVGFQECKKKNCLDYFDQ